VNWPFSNIFLAMQHPELFDNLLSQSGAFWSGNKDVKWELMSLRYEASPRLPIRFFLEAGVLEDVSEDGPTLLQANRNLVAILRRKGYSLTYVEIGGTHEPVHWRNAFAIGLMSLTK